MLTNKKEKIFITQVFLQVRLNHFLGMKFQKNREKMKCLNQRIRSEFRKIKLQ